VVYTGSFAWADGRRLAAFAFKMVRKPDVSLAIAEPAD
jgi:hypothetical protein